MAAPASADYCERLALLIRDIIERGGSHFAGTARAILARRTAGR
jgi:hypothetical protein